MEANDLIERLKNIPKHAIVIICSEFSEPEIYPNWKNGATRDVVLYSDIIKAIEDSERENVERLIG